MGRRRCENAVPKHTVRLKAERGVTNPWVLQAQSTTAQRLPVAALVGAAIQDRSCWKQELQLTPFIAEASHRYARREP